MKKVVMAITMATLALSGNAQMLKNNMLNGYKEGDKLEKAEYLEKKEPIRQDTWCGGFTNNPSPDLKSPVIGCELSYPGYNENGSSIKFGFPEGLKGSRVSVYSLTDGKKYSRGSLYLSFLVNFSKLGTAGFADFIALSPGYESGGNRGTVYVGREGRDKIRFGVGLIKQRTEGAIAYDYDKTHLVVLKIDYNQNEASLFVNPDLNGEEPKAEATVNGGEDILKHAIRGIGLRNRSGYQGNIGNFRLSSSWEGVTAQAQ